MLTLGSCYKLLWYSFCINRRVIVTYQTYFVVGTLHMLGAIILSKTFPSTAAKAFIGIRFTVHLELAEKLLS